MQPAGPVPLISMGSAAAKSARREGGDHKTMFTGASNARVATLAATHPRASWRQHDGPRRAIM